MTTADDATPATPAPASAPSIAEAVPLAVPVQPLEYARPTNTLTYDLRPLAQSMAWLSVMSGLCVGVCFVAAVSRPLWMVLHIPVYAITIALAVKSGARMQPAATAVPRLRSSLRVQLDVVAGVGLVIVGLAPALMMTIESVGAGVIGLAFLMMCATSARHTLLYRALADVAAELNRPGLQKSFLSLGPTKMIYEALWLFCCGVPLVAGAAGSMIGIRGAGDWIIYLAVGAFLGCFGFAILWAWMMAAHFRLLNLVSEGWREPSGY